MTYTYDPNGNVLQQSDARGSAGTIYAGYDGINCQTWRNTTSSPSGAYVTYTYDSTAGGNAAGIGRLTGETFSGPASTGLSGAYATLYDLRGRPTQLTLTAGTNQYVTQQSYTDFDAPSTTYPDGTLATVDYTTSGAPQDLQATLPGSHTTSYVVASASYASTGQLASVGVGGTPASQLYSEAFGYDGDLRLNAESATKTGVGSPFYSLALGFDAAATITSASTATTDVHSYAYDAAGNVSCRAIASGGCTSSPTTGAPYTYDNEGRLSQWANKPSGATVTASELYDGGGERVARQTTSSGMLIVSVYVGAPAEYDTTGSTTTTTDYFTFAGQTIAIRDTAWHYLVADHLGSPVVQLNASGTPELVALKLPYGAGRYAAASLASEQIPV